MHDVVGGFHNCYVHFVSTLVVSTHLFAAESRRLGELNYFRMIVVFGNKAV